MLGFFSFIASKSVKRYGKITFPFASEIIKVFSVRLFVSGSEITSFFSSVGSSLENFKTPFVARFREAFKLAYTKEKKSIKYAFDLGTELLFNYNLHPAIIAGCRNLDELDIYLDYLENSETEKFDCFKIVFEIPPVLKKS